MNKIALTFLLFLTACQSVEKRQERATQIATSHQFKETSFKTTSFILYAQEKILEPSNNAIHIYIEGDGFAWARSNRISTDPTPKNPVALKLAAQDPHPNVVYLARPCQYNLNLNRNICTPQTWTAQRQSEQVVDSLNQAISQIVATHKPRQIVLIGYSGGGGIATIIAARRSDISQLITVAGNLDHVSWTTSQGLSPLTGSLNAIDYAAQLKNVPQVHFVGTEDSVITPSLTKVYMQALGHPKTAKIILIPGQDHYSGWEESWRELLEQEFSE